MSFFFLFFFFFNDTATTEIYTGWYTLSLHDALPISEARRRWSPWRWRPETCRRSEEHTSELQSHHPISYAVFCLKKKKKKNKKKQPIIQSIKTTTIKKKNNN